MSSAAARYASKNLVALLQDAGQIELGWAGRFGECKAARWLLPEEVRSVEVVEECCLPQRPLKPSFDPENENSREPHMHLTAGSP